MLPNYQASTKTIQFQGYKVSFPICYAEKLSVVPYQQYEFPEVANILSNYCEIHHEPSNDKQIFCNILERVKREAGKANIVFQMTSLIRAEVMVFSELGLMCTGILHKFQLRQEVGGEKICLQVGAVGLKLDIWDVVYGRYSVTRGWYTLAAT